MSDIAALAFDAGVKAARDAVEALPAAVSHQLLNRSDVLAAIDEGRKTG